MSTKSLYCKLHLHKSFFFNHMKTACNTKYCRIDSTLRSLHPRALMLHGIHKTNILQKQKKNISIVITISNDSQYMYILIYAKVINTHA